MLPHPALGRIQAMGLPIPQVCAAPGCTATTSEACFGGLHFSAADCFSKPCDAPEVIACVLDVNRAPANFGHYPPLSPPPARLRGRTATGPPTAHPASRLNTPPSLPAAVGMLRSAQARDPARRAEGPSAPAEQAGAGGCGGGASAGAAVMGALKLQPPQPVMIT
jgi:hypothetical protein